MADVVGENWKAYLRHLNMEDINIRFDAAEGVGYVDKQRFDRFGNLHFEVTIPRQWAMYFAALLVAGRIPVAMQYSKWEGPGEDEEAS